jgi:hypothetical protein
MMDAQLLKSKLTEKDIVKIVNKLGGELRTENDNEMIFDSITYDINASGHKPKLYCYKSNFTFVEFHLSMDTFDIFELVKERKKLLGEKYSFIDCMKFVCASVGIDFNSDTIINNKSSFINSNLKRFMNTHNYDYLEVYDDEILNKFEHWYHQSWLDDHISIETMDKYGILYYDYGNQIIIPCHNQYNQLIGIRARNLDPNAGAKYIPYKDINGTWYKFNVGSTFYGLNHTAENITRIKKVIICESEKAVLQGDTYFGDNNIIVGMYGSAMTRTKRNILLGMGIDEVIIAIDFDYIEESYHDEETYEELTPWEIYEKKVYKIADMFKGLCNVSAIVDYHPEYDGACVTDYSKEKFLKLYKNRLSIYGKE